MSDKPDPPKCPICGQAVTVRDGVNAHCRNGHAFREPETIRPGWWPETEAEFSEAESVKVAEEQANRKTAELESSGVAISDPKSSPSTMEPGEAD